MIKINLLAEARPTKKKKGAAALGAAGRLNLFLLGGAIGIGILVIGIRWWVLNSQIKELDENIRRAQAEVTRLEAILREVKDFEEKRARLQKKVDLINQLKQNQRGPVRLMDEVSKALPDLLWLDFMEYRGNTINTRGKAFNPPAVSNFIENLKRVPAFQEPVLKEVVTCQASLYCFQLSFTFANIDKTQPGEAPGAAKPAEPAPGTSTTPGAPPKAERADRPATAVAAGM